MSRKKSIEMKVTIIKLTVMFQKKKKTRKTVILIIYIHLVRRISVQVYIYSILLSAKKINMLRDKSNIRYCYELRTDNKNVRKREKCASRN